MRRHHSTKMINIGLFSFAQLFAHVRKVITFITQRKILNLSVSLLEKLFEYLMKNFQDEFC